MKGGPTDPPNDQRGVIAHLHLSTSMKGGPTDPPNDEAHPFAFPGLVTSMKGGPTDPPNQHPRLWTQQLSWHFNEGGAY